MKEHIKARLQGLMAYLDDSTVEVRERIFVLLSLIALSGIVLALVAGIIIGENPESLAFTFLGFVIFATIVYLGYRLRKLSAAAIVAAAFTIFVTQPLNFITSGGVYGGAALWWLFSLLYVGMILKGKTRVFFFTAAAVIVSGCWYLQYTNPKLVIEHERDAVFADSLGSLVIVCVLLMILICFQAWLYEKENVRVEEQRKQIEDLNAAQSSLFSSLSHEIRTPINTIIGLNEMILRENASEEINEDAENIKVAGTMLLHLINDILDMSKLESGQMELDVHSYRTGEMLSEIVGMFWLRAHEKGLDFRVEIAPDMPSELSGDEIRIRQILINVINNAIKYTPAGSVKLSVQMERIEGNRVKIIYTVADTGIGIRKESISHLFDAFSRADGEGTRYIEGTGLGLSIVKQLVELMGGKVSVNSIYTKGSTFVIEIPQYVVDAQVMEDIVIERRKNPSRRSSYRQSFEAPEAKVLTVDDTEANLLVVEKLLRDTKVQMTVARSGAEALKATLDTAFDVIFMDHMMPEMDGIECMHRIREQTGGMSREARIVALTANAGGANAALYEKEGFDGYIVKPISGKELENELCRLLPRTLVTFTGTDDAIIEDSIVRTNEHRKKSMVAITTESVADLPMEVKKKFGIEVIPYRIVTETGVFKDGEDLQTLGTLAYLGSGRKAYSIPPTAEEYERFFAGALESANNVVHLAQSSKVRQSGCEAALFAASSFDNVFVIDSKQLSGGLTLLALEACRLAREGRGTAYITEWISAMRGKVHSSFVVDNIDYLVSQYEIRPVLSKIAKAFMLHPILYINDGRLRLYGVRMGSIRSTAKHYIASAFPMPQTIDKSMLLIVYAGLDIDELEWIKNQVARRIPFEQVILQCASPAIAVNSGPGAFGLLYRTL